ncbi:MAG TPA: hypothetical protein VMZ74_11940 [Ramlibacter sp.]|nr:hypothetical protein [Ramlibacter sp.]
MKPFAVLISALLFAAGTHAANALGAAALRSQYASMATRLATSELGGPLVLQSEDAGRRIDGEVFGVVEHPFETVASALAEQSAWCEILILHQNTKSCRRTTDARGTTLEIRVGKKGPQAPEQASLLAFRWVAATKRPDYVAIRMEADEGPYDTRDYRLFTEAVPLDGGRTFVHMGYAFSSSGAGSLAMGLYLATVARGKIGFTHEGDKYVGGVRGIAERNTLRYFLAIDAFLSQSQPEKRIAQWYDATERYPRQLHELERDEYLKMKREELKRPQK